MKQSSVIRQRLDQAEQDARTTLAKRYARELPGLLLDLDQLYDLVASMRQAVVRNMPKSAVGNGVIARIRGNIESGGLLDEDFASLPTDTEQERRAAAILKEYSDVLISASLAKKIAAAALDAFAANVVDPAVLLAVRRDIDVELRKHGIDPDPPDGGERTME